MDQGVFTVGSISAKEVLRAVALAVSMRQNGELGAAVASYADPVVSTKVVKIIQSYAGIIDRMVWRKS